MSLNRKKKTDEKWEAKYGENNISKKKKKNLKKIFYIQTNYTVNVFRNGQFDRHG